MSDIKKAEKLGRKRARIWCVAGLILPAVQWIYFDQPTGAPVAPHKLILWGFLILTMLFALWSCGGFGYGRKVRALVNDESALANRDAAVRLGFLAAMVAGLAVCLFAYHHAVSGQFAAQIVITTGLGVSLVRFGVLEWRGHSLG